MIDFAIVRWFLHRVTGVALAACLIVHTIVIHLSGESAINLHTVSGRIQDSLLWGVFYLVFLGAVLFHGLNGVYEIIIDYAPPVLVKNGAAILFSLIGLLAFVWGIVVLVSWYAV
ncbi:MAG: hypothetical protein HY762_04135 [Planctomycetes bacterium]|nr:hypothetical protein [Planctomycetota bacterium]